MNEVSTTEVYSERKRPLGVKVLTIYFGIFAGLFPIVLTLVVFFHPSARAEVYLPVSSVVLALIVNGCVVYSAVKAWKGKNWAPLVFIAAVSVHYLLVAWNNFNAMNSGDIESSKAVARMLRAPFVIGIVAWYFFSSKARESSMPILLAPQTMKKRTLSSRLPKGRLNTGAAAARQRV